MKRQYTKQSGVTPALTGAILLGTALCALAGQPEVVTGSHSYTWEAGGPSLPGVETLHVQVVRHADGTVTGEAHNSLRDGDTIVWQAHLRIDCMVFLDDHTVLLAGVDVWDSDPTYVGNTFAFGVRDNGEGFHAAPDQCTPVHYSNDVGFELDCEVVLALIAGGLYDPEPDLLPAETGNIQVKP